MLKIFLFKQQPYSTFFSIQFNKMTREGTAKLNHMAAYSRGKVQQPHPSVAKYFGSTSTSSGRVSKPVTRYGNESYVAGTNNAYTVGRATDGYDRRYKG